MLRAACHSLLDSRRRQICGCFVGIACEILDKLAFSPETRQASLWRRADNVLNLYEWIFRVTRHVIADCSVRLFFILLIVSLDVSLYAFAHVRGVS